MQEQPRHQSDLKAERSERIKRYLDNLNGTRRTIAVGDYVTTADDKCGRGLIVLDKRTNGDVVVSLAPNDFKHAWVLPEESLWNFADYVDGMNKVVKDVPLTKEEKRLQAQKAREEASFELRH